MAKPKGGRRLSLYFPTAMLREIHDEARRLRVSVSWVVRRAWKESRSERARSTPARSIKKRD